MVKRVLVTGKNGQLGLSLHKLISDSSRLIYPNDKFVFKFVGRDDLCLSSNQLIVNYFMDNPFDAIINCAAYTSVDKAEFEPDLANQINHFAVAKMAEVAKQHGIPLIHISTDYVFNGNVSKPYDEKEPTAPESVYGLTKLHGEQAILASGCTGAIIRTSWVYSEFGNNFVKTMLRLGKERDSLNIIYDQIGCPTYAMDLAEVILKVLIDKCFDFSSLQHLPTQRSKLNIYHFSNEGLCSWYDFTKSIFELTGLNCLVNPIGTQDYPTPAKRPHYSVMNKSKIKLDLALQIPYWRDSLKVCLKNLEE
jgi:dTDP-4-dehydrorhamnose reductase